MSRGFTPETANQIRQTLNALTPVRTVCLSLMPAEARAGEPLLDDRRAATAKADTHLRTWQSKAADAGPVGRE